MSKRQKSPILLPAQLRHRISVPQDLKLSRRSYWSYLLNGIGIVVTVFGAYVTYLELGPAFTTTPLDSMDISSPLASTPFAITNSSLVDIGDVRFICDANRVNFTNGNLAAGNSIRNSSEVIRIMRRNETLTVACPIHIFFDSEIVEVSSLGVEIGLMELDLPAIHPATIGISQITLPIRE